jgi:hypothetical protein
MMPSSDAVQLIKDNQHSLDASHLDVLSVQKMDENNYRIVGMFIKYLQNRMNNTHFDIPTNLATKYVMFEARMKIRFQPLE